MLLLLEIYDECECTPLLKENGTKLYGIADRDYLEGELFHVKFLGTHVDDKGNITFYRSFSTTTKLCTVIVYGFLLKDECLYFAQTEFNFMMGLIYF